MWTKWLLESRARILRIPDENKELFNIPLMSHVVESRRYNSRPKVRTQNMLKSYSLISTDDLNIGIFWSLRQDKYGEYVKKRFIISRKQDSRKVKWSVTYVSQ